MTEIQQASTNPQSTSSGYEADERIAARHAVTLADEKWRSLCTQHASTFVAAERRHVSVQKALQELLIKIESETKPSVKRVGKALDPNYNSKSSSGDDVNNEGEYDDEEEEEDEPPIQPATALLADLAEKHRLRRRTLMQHSSLLELLELPSLMDACVRSSLYEDALSIAGFANTLERRHLLEQQQGSSSTEKKEDDGNKQQQQTSEPKGDVVAGVVQEIRRREADLRRMLIHRLRQDVTMPQCLEVVTALRRLNGVELERRNNSKSLISSSGAVANNTTTKDYDLESVHAAMEMRLQVDFLEARDAWLEGGVTTIGSAQAAAVVASSSTDNKGNSTSAQAEQILDGIERYRTRCFEIVTQFLAIFRGSFAQSTASSSSNNHDHSFSLLSMWTARRIQTFLTTLGSNMTTHVHDTATLRDALDAASFFASSMGRVGADFQPLLAPIFEPRLTEMVVGQWNDGLTGMVETLKACRDAGVASPLFGAETSNKDGESGSNADGIEMMMSSRTPAPPRKLLAMPPLARFLNAYLGGLNELRRCLLPSAFPAIRSAQAKLLADVKLALQQNERAALTPGLRGEASKLREIASKMKTEFDNCLEPYMTSCLNVALGSVDYAVEEAKKAAEKARVAAEKERAEREEKEKEKARIAAEQEILRKERIEKDMQEARERRRKELEEKAAAEKSAAAVSTDENEDILGDDDADMYGSDSD